MSQPVLRLVGIRGDRVGESIALGVTPVIIGRDPGCPVSIPDQTISRRHVQVLSTPSGAWIEDLGSANGVFLNGQRLAGPVVLQPNDEFTIGGQTFRFEVVTSSVVVERGSQERGSTAVPSALTAPGCLPNLGGQLGDLSGFLPGLVRYFPWLIGLVVVLVVISLAVKLLGAIVDVATGSKPQPTASSSPAPEGEKQSAGDIEILETVVENTVQGPVIRVRWRNGTSNPVRKIEGDVEVRDASGESLLEIKDTVIYSGDPVPAGATHEIGRGTAIALPMGTAKGKIKITPKRSS